MIKLIDTSFFAGNREQKLMTLIERHHAALGYVEHFKILADIQVIKHVHKSEAITLNGIKYTGLKRRNSFWQIPLPAIRYIKEQMPDIIIVQGLIFPLQVIFLRKSLSRNTIILVQHHGEKPSAGLKGWIQKKADRCIDGYLFTSSGNATAWINAGIIRNETKCFELLEASTDFEKQDKLLSKQQYNLTGDLNFLWVGRLNAGKDPLTVIKAFADYSGKQPQARLYMIFQTEELLPEIKKIIKGNNLLEEKIILVGAVTHEALESWYSAADFYISGSHFEGSGYALLEAMACGCIPVVTDIASFRTITADGKYAVLYPPGNVAALVEELGQLHKIDRVEMSAAVSHYFREKLSFAAIAANLYQLCRKLTLK